MLSAHPLLDIDTAGGWLVDCIHVFIILLLCNLQRGALLSGARLQIWLKVFQKCHFLLKLFWIVSERILLKDILFFCLRDGLALVIVETVAFLFNYNFSWVIEEDTSWLVRKQVPEAILGTVIDPLGHPYSMWVRWCNQRQLVSVLLCSHWHIWQNLVAGWHATKRLLYHWSVRVRVTWGLALKLNDLVLLRATSCIVLLQARRSTNHLPGFLSLQHLVYLCSLSYWLESRCRNLFLFPTQNSAIWQNKVTVSCRRGYLWSNSCTRTKWASAAHRPFLAELVNRGRLLKSSWEIGSRCVILRCLHNLITVWHELSYVFSRRWTCHKRLRQSFRDLASMIKEIVFENLFQIRPHLRVSIQNLCN